LAALRERGRGAVSGVVLLQVGVNVVFMAAFSIPITAFTVFLVASSHMLSGVFALTPGGVGQTQALDVATLRGRAASADIARSRLHRTQ
jgi:uncharacterized membrane protein YbhN (UPF0104 family)